jgi:hypothetical protein
MTQRFEGNKDTCARATKRLCRTLIVAHSVLLPELTFCTFAFVFEQRASVLPDGAREVIAVLQKKYC